jgi:alpha-beta hydrolase superfamily lysophospholipase/SAM-dependent methyltransferase
MNPRRCEESVFRTREGLRIFYRHWPGATNKAVAILHRGHEHSGRVAHLAEELDLPDYSLFAWDARAHGRSEGTQDASVTMATFVRDLDEFIRHLHTHHRVATQDIAVIAQSFGAVFAAAWVHDFAPAIRCLILAAPAFSVKLYVPFARLGLGVWHRLAGDFLVNSYVMPEALTRDPERIASYRTDPLIRRPISARVLLGLYPMAERIVADAQAIRVPVQLLLSGNDWVVHRGPQVRFYERLGTSVKEMHTFPGLLHDTLGERDRAQPIAKAREFILRNFAAPLSRESTPDNHYTTREYEALSRPLSPLSAKGWIFAATRFGMRTGGRLSDGIRLGLRTGFDSGSTLDYVYENRASGITPAGKWIDRLYLDAIGWRGIRARKALLEEMIGRAIEWLRASHMPVHLLDIAAGHGRYVLDAVQRTNVAPDSILLRDFSEDNVLQGRELARKMNMAVQFERANAFDAASFAALDPKPTLGIVSGLYELFPSNEEVDRSLRAFAGAMQEGGYLIYTGQPWHPQLEMIARTLTSHRGGAPWIMRRRTQHELDALICAAGFEKVEQRIDEWGIFTVSVARRVGPAAA